jgi:hypothetical protein
MRRLVAVVVIGWLVAEPAAAAVLCAKPRKGGVFNGSVKIRETCRPGETQLAPEDVGFCCNQEPVTTSTTSTSTTTVSCPIHTTTTLGIPDCGGSNVCFGLCANARACVPSTTNGVCECSGPELPCGVVTAQGACGGACPIGSACQLYEPLLPSGCTDVPRCACVPTL